jgi:hypothetical protein
LGVVALYHRDSKRDTIYLLPLGINEQPSAESDDDDCDGKRKRKRKRMKKEEVEEEEYDLQFDEVNPAAPTIAQLAEFVAAFFCGLKVKIMPPLSFVKEKGSPAPQLAWLVGWAHTSNNWLSWGGQVVCTFWRRPTSTRSRPRSPRPSATSASTTWTSSGTISHGHVLRVLCGVWRVACGVSCGVNLA